MALSESIDENGMDEINEASLITLSWP